MLFAAANCSVYLSLAASAPGAELTVGSGAAFDLGTGVLDLGCASLVVAGSFAVGNGTVDQALDVTISLGGNLDGGNGTLNITGNWDNSAGGMFNAGTGSVNFVDGCALGVAAITGSTTFSTLTLTTTTGKTYQLAAGSTQTIGAVLSISGVAGNLLNLASTSAGSEATLDLQGSAMVDFVDAQDIHASPNPIVFGPNSVVGTNIAGFELCGDIDSSFVIDIVDVTLAREHLMGKTIVGDITLCNVIGPFDPLEGGADCGVDDIFVLERLVAGQSVTAETACKP